MTQQSQFSPSIRAGPDPGGGGAGAEHEARERSRETAYRPDGSVAATREWERLRVWRRPAAALPVGRPGLAGFSFVDALKEFLLLWLGAHCLLAVAIAGGALAKWSGHSPVVGYVVTCFLLYWFGVRPRM